MFCGFKTQCFRGEVKTQCFGGLKTVFWGLKTVFFGLIGFSKESRSGVVFPPHNGGETEIWRFLPPHISRPWGGNSSFCPPIFRDPGGEIQVFSPSNGGEMPAAGGKF